MIYRFKVWFEDQEDIIRWIDIKPGHTMQHLHNIIQESIGFDGKELASFFVSDDRWRRLKEVQLDASANAVNSGDVVYKSQTIGGHQPILMETVKIRELVNDPHQRFVYVSDYAVLWTLYCELVAIAETDAKKTYPSIYRSEGKAPRQREDGKFKMLDDDEFDALAEKILAAKNAKALLIEQEEELLDGEDDEDDFDDEEDDADENNDEFGFGEFEDGLDADDLK
jgi:hypothetical protein